MKLEQQVSSLELSQKLKEFGVKQESLFWWDGNGRMHGFNIHYERPVPPNRMYGNRDEVCSAFTVAELGEMLKKGKHLLIPVTMNNEWHGVDLIKNDHLVLGRVDELTEADARAKMLIYLVENKLVTP